MQLEISVLAQKEMDLIFRYGLNHFGEAQARACSAELFDLFDLILENPRMARVRPEYRRQVRMFVFESHMVFYRILRNKVRVLRVLHGKQTWPKHF